MKTEYRIIWVDDEIDAVAADIDDTEELLSDFGIEAQIITFKQTEEVDIHDKIQPELQNDELDLIVIDFLMEGTNGSELINLIRDSDRVLLPVIFYSQNGTEVLRNHVKDAKLDGVYITGRDHLREKIEAVIKSLLRKEQTSKRTRGLLMEGVSEIDAQFGELFVKRWDMLGDKEKVDLIEYFKKKLADRATSASALHDSLPLSFDEFRSYMADNFVSTDFDTNTRWKVIKKAFELLNINNDELKIFERLFIKKGEIEPLCVLRNKYGHQTRKELEKTHDENVCKSIREELRAQLNNMSALLSQNGGK